MLQRRIHKVRMSAAFRIWGVDRIRHAKGQAVQHKPFRRGRRSRSDRGSWGFLGGTTAIDRPGCPNFTRSPINRPGVTVNDPAGRGARVQ